MPLSDESEALRLARLDFASYVNGHLMFCAADADTHTRVEASMLLRADALISAARADAERSLVERAADDERVVEAMARVAFDERGEGITWEQCDPEFKEAMRSVVRGALAATTGSAASVTATGAEGTQYDPDYVALAGITTVPVVNERRYLSDPVYHAIVYRLRLTTPTREETP